MNYLDAAEKILEEAQRPLTYQQITAIALERSWIEPQGNDPSNIMNTLIMQDLKSYGIKSRFSRLAPGTYSLRKLVYKNSLSEQEEKPEKKPEQPPEHIAKKEETVPSQLSETTMESNMEAEMEMAKGNNKVKREYRPKVSGKELWEAMEILGTVMGYKIHPVMLLDKKTTCMGWMIGGNPELAFILWVKEGTDMEKGITFLINQNYHKVVVMVEESEFEEAADFLSTYMLRGKTDLITTTLLYEQAKIGSDYMEFYNRLCDCRPLKYRKSFIIG